MPHTEIRRVTGDELLDAIKLRAYAFRPSPPLPDREVLEKTDRWSDASLHLVVCEDGQAVATVASTPMTQHVRGKIIAGGGVWGVATHPIARRKGYIRRLLTELYEDQHATGAPLSTLYPFRESFYERLGYTTFPQPRVMTFATSALLPVLKVQTPGSVEMMSVADGWDEHRAFLRRRQQQIHGMSLFDDRALEPGGSHWLALARVDGVTVGAMTYRISGQEGRLTVRTFYYDNSHGKYLLLDWLARHTDHAKEIELLLPPFEQPETWLSDLFGTIRIGDVPMARVVDLAGLEGIDAGPGAVTVQLQDPLCPWNTGCFRLESVEGHLHVEPAHAADCNLTIQAISALVYGTHNPDDFWVRGWGAPSPEIVAMLRTMFPPRLPFLHEIF